MARVMFWGALALIGASLAIFPASWIVAGLGVFLAGLSLSNLAVLARQSEAD